MMTVNKLSDVIANHKPGDTIESASTGGNSKQKIEVKLGRQSSSP